MKPTGLWAALAAAVLQLAPVGALYAAMAPDAVLYQNAVLIDGTGAKAKPGQDILVQGDRIVAIASHGALAAADVAEARKVDLTGRYVLPGLIDSHVHLATPPNRAQAEARLKRDLYGGVTAVRDMADDLRAVAELARQARAGETPSPDIYYAALMAGRPFFGDPRVGAASEGFAPGTAPWMQAIDDETDLPTAVTLARGTAATAIKIYADLPPGLVRAITAEAHRQHMLVWTHSAIFPTRPAEVIAAGPDTISHVCYLAYQAEPVMLAAYEDHTPVHEALIPTDHDPVMAGLFQDMARRGEVLDATGSLFVKEEATTRASGHPLRCTGQAVVRLTRQAWRAGVAISTGTDFTNPPDQLWPEVFEEVFFLVRQVGMTPLEAIRSATLVGAQAAGQAQNMGTVEVGKIANLVVLRSDPLADIGALQTIDFVVKRGRTYQRSQYSLAKSSDRTLADGH